MKIKKIIHSACDLTISTWQSLQKQSPSYFNQFAVIFVDEAHGAAAKVLTEIIGNATDVYHRFGFTGTLQDSKTHELVLQGLFGKIFQTTTTAELIENGYASPFKVKAIILHYPEDDRKLVSKMDYADEYNYIIAHNGRMRFIRNLALSLEGNTLIFVNNRDTHAIPLFDEINSNIKGNRKVHLIHGKIDADVVEEVRALIETVDNDIIVATYKKLSTGSNFKKLHNIIFASPTKAKITVLQSIGRTLRLAIGKDVATLFDVVDDLSWKKKINYTLRHFKERLEMYINECFTYKIYNVDLK